MFDRYIVVDGSLRNITLEGKVTGYAVDARIPYYRGLGLSMVEIDMVVDEVPIPRREVTFTVHGHTYDSSEMDEIFDDRWGFTETATLNAASAGGLAGGPHQVTLKVLLRVSYGTPGGSVTTGTKTMTVRA